MPRTIEDHTPEDGSHSLAADGNQAAWRAHASRLLLIAFCICALANSRMALSTVSKKLKSEARYAPTELIPRYEPLRSSLPEGARVGFMVDDQHSDLQLWDPLARLYLARYALSPRLVESGTTQDLVIVDSDDPATAPEIAKHGGWTLVADLMNGVRIYPALSE
ncbi:MAG: hypothetical protein ACOY3P_08960 [Planctomycetota bacterium]